MAFRSAVLRRIRTLTVTESPLPEHHLWNLRSMSSYHHHLTKDQVKSFPKLHTSKATLLHQTAFRSLGFQRHGMSTSASSEFIKKKEIHVGALTRIQRVTKAWVWHINEGVENILADYVHNGITRNVMAICFKLLMLIVTKDVIVLLLSL